jgi:hypothetical protein
VYARLTILEDLDMALEEAVRDVIEQDGVDMEQAVR